MSGILSSCCPFLNAAREGRVSPPYTAEDMRLRLHNWTNSLSGSTQIPRQVTASTEDKPGLPELSSECSAITFVKSETSFDPGDGEGECKVILAAREGCSELDKVVAAAVAADFHPIPDGDWENERGLEEEEVTLLQRRQAREDELNITCLERKAAKTVLPVKPQVAKFGLLSALPFKGRATLNPSYLPLVPEQALEPVSSSASVLITASPPPQEHASLETPMLAIEPSTYANQRDIISTTLLKPAKLSPPNPSPVQQLLSEDSTQASSSSELLEAISTLSAARGAGKSRRSRMTTMRAPTPWSAIELDEDDEDETPGRIAEEDQLERVDSSDSGSPFASVADTAESSYHTLVTVSSSVERADRADDHSPPGRGVEDEGTAAAAEEISVSGSAEIAWIVTETGKETAAEIASDANDLPPRQVVEDAEKSAAVERTFASGLQEIAVEARHVVEETAAHPALEPEIGNEDSLRGRPEEDADSAVGAEQALGSESVDVAEVVIEVVEELTADTGSQEAAEADNLPPGQIVEDAEILAGAEQASVSVSVETAGMATKMGEEASPEIAVETEDRRPGQVADDAETMAPAEQASDSGLTETAGMATKMGEEKSSEISAETEDRRPGQVAGDAETMAPAEQASASDLEETARAVKKLGEEASTEMGSEIAVDDVDLSPQQASGELVVIPGLDLENGLIEEGREAKEFVKEMIAEIGSKMTAEANNMPPGQAVENEETMADIEQFPASSSIDTTGMATELRENTAAEFASEATAEAVDSPLGKVVEDDDMTVAEQISDSGSVERTGATIEKGEETTAERTYEKASEAEDPPPGQLLEDAETSAVVDQTSENVLAETAGLATEVVEETTAEMIEAKADADDPPPGQVVENEENTADAEQTSASGSVEIASVVTEMGEKAIVKMASEILAEAIEAAETGTIEETATTQEAASHPVAVILAEPEPEPVTEPMADTATEQLSELVTEPRTEQVIGPVVEPRGEPITVAEPATEPVADPLTEAVTEPVAEAATGTAEGAASGDQPPAAIVSDGVNLRYFCGAFRPVDHHMTRFAGLAPVREAPEPQAVPSGRSDSAVLPAVEGGADTGRTAASDSTLPLGGWMSSPGPPAADDSGVRLEAKQSSTDIPM